MSNTLPYLVGWLQVYGYPILWLSVFMGALGIPLPNTLVLLAAGAFAAFGDFNFMLLAVVSISAFIAGDSSSYWIGRLWGSKFLNWLETSGRFRLIKPQTVARSRVYFHRLGGWAIFLSRFLASALGGAINILGGAELFPFRRFLVYDICGEILGAMLPLTLGYIFGTSWDAMGNLLGSFSIFVLALLIVLFLGYQAFSMFRRLRKQGDVEEKQSSGMLEHLLKQYTVGEKRLPSMSRRLQKQRVAREEQPCEGALDAPGISAPFSASDRASSSPGNLPL